MDARRRKLEDLERRLEEKRSKLLDNIAQLDLKKMHGAVRELRQEGTGIWFLESPEFREWLKSKNSRLWLYGIRKSLCSMQVHKLTILLNSWRWENGSNVCNESTFLKLC